MLLARPSSRRTPALARRNGFVRGIDVALGFTLLELLTSIAVIAILCTLAIGAVQGAKERVKIAQARGELASLAAALEEFKRLYGDYPQTGEFAQAGATPTGQSTTLPNGTGPGTTFAQVRLFNCLTGVYGARPDERGSWTRISGPNLLPPQFLDAQHLNGLNIQSGLPANFGVPTTNASSPPSKPEQNFSILDPWGRRYCYYYKNARNPNQWQASGYVLFSAGPKVAANGTQTPPITATTGLMLPNQTAEMADNIYATP